MGYVIETVGVNYADNVFLVAYPTDTQMKLHNML